MSARQAIEAGSEMVFAIPEVLGTGADALSDAMHKTSVFLGDASQGAYETWQGIKDGVAKARYADQWQRLGELAAQIPEGPFKVNQSGDPALRGAELKTHGHVSKIEFYVAANIFENSPSPLTSKRRTHIGFYSGSVTDSKQDELRATEVVRGSMDFPGRRREVVAGPEGVIKGDLPLSRVLRAMQKIDHITGVVEDSPKLKDRLLAYRERAEVARISGIVESLGRFHKSSKDFNYVTANGGFTYLASGGEQKFVLKTREPSNPGITHETIFTFGNDGQLASVLRASKNNGADEFNQMKLATPHEVGDRDRQAITHRLSKLLDDPKLVQELSNPPKQPTRPKLPNYKPLSYK